MRRVRERCYRGKLGLGRRRRQPAPLPRTAAALALPLRRATFRRPPTPTALPSPRHNLLELLQPLEQALFPGSRRRRNRRRRSAASRQLGLQLRTSHRVGSEPDNGLAPRDHLKACGGEGVGLPAVWLRSAASPSPPSPAPAPLCPRAPPALHPSASAASCRCRRHEPEPAHGGGG